MSDIFHICRNGTIGDIESIRARGADLYVKDTDNSTVLHYAARNESEHALDIIKLLIDGGMDPNATDSRGTTPLLACVKDNHGEYAACIVRLLLDRGADIRAKTPTNPLLFISSLLINQSKCWIF